MNEIFTYQIQQGHVYLFKSKHSITIFSLEVNFGRWPDKNQSKIHNFLMEFTWHEEKEHEVLVKRVFFFDYAKLEFDDQQRVVEPDTRYEY